MTVTRSHDDWVLNMLDKSTKAKVVNEDKTFIRLSNKVHLATGPLFQAWSLAEEIGCKPVVKHMKKSVLALGQFQLTLNHERRMLSYGEICKDHGKAKEHLKEASDSFAKVAKNTEKPPLFGEKFKRAVIDRGTLSKQLKETPKFQQQLQKEPRYQSPLQKVQPEQQQANQSDHRTSYNQPFPSDPAKKASGRSRGGRYVSTKHNTCLHSGQRIGLHCCTGAGVARTLWWTVVSQNSYLVHWWKNFRVYLLQRNS